MRSEERSYRLSTSTPSSLLGGEFTSANHLVLAATRTQRFGVWTMSKYLKISSAFNYTSKIKNQLMFLCPEFMYLPHYKFKSSIF